MPNTKKLLSITNLKKYFPVAKTSIFQKNTLYVRANEDITIDIYEGETLGIVGESGCGKTTTGRCIIRLYDITSGSIYYRGVRISAGNRWNKKEIKYSGIHAKQQIEALRAEEAEKAATLSAEDAAKLHEEIAAKIKAIQERHQLVVREQQAKIRQIHHDNAYFDKRLMNEIPIDMSLLIA